MESDPNARRLVCGIPRRPRAHPRNSPESLPTALCADNRQETQGCDLFGRRSEPGPHGAPVGREGVTQQRAMASQPPSVCARVLHDHPYAGRCRVPPSFRGNPVGKPAPPVHLGNEVVHVDEHRLEFHDEDRAAGGMPSEEIDHASLSVDGIRDLLREQPSVEQGELACSCLLHGGVPAAEETVEVCAAPPNQYVDSRAEDLRQRAQLEQAHVGEITALDRGEELPRHTRPLGDIRLAKYSS
jgi:hypothetical protein